MEPSPSSSSTAPKRNRPTLSCVQCRQAKAKCDRQNPCALCVRKGRAEQCTYPLPVSRKKAAVSLQKRLRNLESMVKDVMASNERSPVSSGSHDLSLQASRTSFLSPFDTSTTSESAVQPRADSNPLVPTSQVVIDGNESRYIGSTHWKALLENVSRTYPS